MSIKQIILERGDSTAEEIDTLLSEYIADKLTYIVFTSKWDDNGPKLLDIIYDELPADSTITLINIDIDMFPELARGYDIHTVPSLYVYGTDGNRILREYGVLTRKELVMLIKYIDGEEDNG
jgi:hypothetical protein